MEFIFFAAGFVVGFAIAKICEIRKKTSGVIQVDHQNGLCTALITSTDVQKRGVKRAIFKIDHDANLSREEHLL